MWPMVYAGIGAVGMVCSVLVFLFPRVYWQFRFGWMYQNAKPSRMGLSMARARGVIGILVSAGFFVIAYFMFTAKR